MDDRPGELDEDSVLAAARAAVRAEKRAGCQLLEAAAAWADLHPSESLLTPAERLEWYGEKAILYGGEGTPDVAETAAGTLGMEIGMNPDQARKLIADALDARDRLTGLWDQVRAGRVRRDTVHRVASRTRHLSVDQAGTIGARISTSLTRLTPGQRLDNLLDAQIKQVDAEQLERLAAEAVHDRYVRKSRPDANGMTDVWFRTTESDAEASMAAITRLAKMLRARRHDLPAGVPVRGAIDGGPGGADGTDGRDGLDEWRAVAAQLLQTNPGLALQIQLQADQPHLFDHAATKLAGLQRPDADPQPTLGGSRDADSDGDHGDHQPAAPAVGREAVIGELVAGLVKQIDFTRLQPAATLYVHICEQALDGPFGPADPQARLARGEGLGPLYLQTVRQWLGQACTVKLQPIIDTGNLPAIDRYEFPPALREAILTRSPASVFPWSNSLNRRNDLDHTIPYLPPDRGGPPGQTGLHNAGPLTRREHRYKTFGPIAVRQPQPDTYVWKTKHGRVLIVNPTGTFDLGTGDFARTLWAAPQHRGVQSLLETRVRQLLGAA